MDGLSEQELLTRITNFEDQFTERKTSKDTRGWLRTIVAFANSCPVGYPAVLYVGVSNEGIPEQQVNLESLQKTVSEIVSAAYPPIYILPRIVNVIDTQVLAIIVPGSESRPHFAGKSFIREGTQTLEASEPQFDSLIAQRNSAAYYILRWRGQKISFYLTGQFGDQTHDGTEFTVVDCNQFFVTLQQADGPLSSFALRRVEITFDHAHSRLGVGVDYR